MTSFGPSQSLQSQIGILAVLALLSALVIAMALLKRRWSIHPELPRKCIHVAMGLALLGLPWIFQAVAPVVVLAVLATACLLLLRYAAARDCEVGQVLHWEGRERNSVGDLLFPVTVLLLFSIAQGNPVLYSIPLLYLTLADPVACVVGLAFGQSGTRWWNSSKTLEGSAGCFFSVVLCTAIPLLAFTDTAPMVAICTALLIGLPITLIEAGSPYGLDNLTVPTAGVLMLDHLLTRAHEELVAYFGMQALVAAVIFLARPWSQRTRDILLAIVLLFGLAAILGTGAIDQGGESVQIGRAGHE